MAQLLVQRACVSLRSAIGDEAVVRSNFTGDLQEMLDALEVVQPVLKKVGMRQWREITAAEFLLDVRQVAYRVMDMIDELQDKTPPAVATMTRMLPRLAIRKNAMATKVEKMKNEVIRLKDARDFYVSYDELAMTHMRLLDGRLTGPYFEKASVIGRRADKQRILAVLISAASNITQGPPSCIILPIFGLGESGKTTLAQLVFNDDTHSLQEYNFRVWVHVSPEFDFHRICESILIQVLSGGRENEEINDHGSNSDGMGTGRIIKRLHELLNGKKVLLVLDDLWEEDSIQLQLLKSMLTFLGDKVGVIVTTCNQAIARKICTVEPYRLNRLGDDACWEIIRQSVSFEVQEELEKIGREIASKCHGLPSAALAFARMLDSRNPSRWEDVMKRNFFYSYFGSGLRTLFLSYWSMPPDLKLCFSYCCDVFPNGHNIVKDDLIHQWIALQLIEPSEILSATQVAEGYITRLLDMSFFQTAKSDPASENDDKYPAMFTIHDLAHVFASWMSQQVNQQCMQYMLLTNCRGKLDDQYDSDLRALRCVNCTNLVFSDGSFSSKRFLRVLELKESSVPKLPDSICKLRYLVYLKITEFSGLVTLPESFGDLTNLFHIDLSGCSVLAVLPESFGNLINLSHVNLSRCHALAEFPEPLQKLGKLVHLDLSFWSCFEEIGKGLGGLTKLEHLNLSHPCCLLTRQRSNLQQLKDGLCKLTSLRYLNLSMCLNPIFYYHQSQEYSLQYIGECLGGLSSLEQLDLSHNTFLVDLPAEICGIEPNIIGPI